MRYFMYNRKSLEDKERQVLSIESQRRDNERLCERQDDVQVVEILCEEKSAKKTGRPVFTEMIRRVMAGEADGIIAWNPDRLARNPVDGGTIIHLLDLGVLKDLKFATYTFENTPQGKLMLGILLANAKYESDYLSKKVERGMRDRAAVDRWLPNRPVTGYLNAIGKERIIPDPARFPLLRRAFELILGGAHSPRQVWRLATQHWGLTSRDGRPITISGFYNLLGNPFYAGVITWKGRTYEGRHQPLVNLDEFEKVQDLLGRPSRPRPKCREFAYTGLMRCGECGLSITAENKTNRFGTEYVYYHCTRRRRDYECSQPVIEVRDLNAQMLAFLESLYLAPQIEQWVLTRLERAAQDSGRTGEAAQRNAAESLRAVERQLRNLTDLRLRDMVTDEDFLVRKADLDRRRLQLSQAVAKPDDGTWFEPARTVTSFRSHAASAFSSGDEAQKRFIIENVGSNPLLKDKKLSIDARKPFQRLPPDASFPDVCTYVEDVRTFCTDSGNQKSIAKMREIVASQRASSGASPAADTARSAGDRNPASPPG